MKETQIEQKLSEESNYANYVHSLKQFLKISLGY